MNHVSLYSIEDNSRINFSMLEKDTGVAVVFKSHMTGRKRSISGSSMDSEVSGSPQKMSKKERTRSISESDTERQHSSSGLQQLGKQKKRTVSTSSANSVSAIDKVTSKTENLVGKQKQNSESGKNAKNRKRKGKNLEIHCKRRRGDGDVDSGIEDEAQSSATNIQVRGVGVNFVV